MAVLVTGGNFINDNHLLRGMVKYGSDGRFIQERKPFSLDNFNNGYVDNKGRFRVWSPNHPRAYEEGYILRAIVAYEAYHKTTVPQDQDIHHIDGNRLNDSEENLKMMSHGQHNIITHSRKDAHIERTCKHCGNKFEIERWRLKDNSRGQFCSQKCYHIHERSQKHKDSISKGLKKAYREGRR